MKPGSEEWHKFRAGRFTASECSALMGEKGGVTTATAQTYILEKVAEVLTGGWKEEVTSKSIQWGNDLEPEAALYYEMAFKQTIEKPDPQCPDWSDDVSGSPDGIVYTQSDVYGIEIKAPYNPANHVRYMQMKSEQDLKKISKDYYWQVLCYMLIFGLDKYEFVSYDPRFTGANRMYVLEFKRKNVQADIDSLKENLLKAIEIKQQILSEI